MSLNHPADTDFNDDQSTYPSAYYIQLSHSFHDQYTLLLLDRKTQEGQYLRAKPIRYYKIVQRYDKGDIEQARRLGVVCHDSKELLFVYLSILIEVKLFNHGLAAERMSIGET